MTDAMRRELDFLLFDWLKVDELADSEAFSGQDRDDWSAFLDLSQAISANEFLPCYKATDRDEPLLENGTVRVQEDLRKALAVYLEAGLHLASVDVDAGGMGLPLSVSTAAMSGLMAANVAGSAFIMLSAANARVILDFGTPGQIAAFARPQLEGRALGTMCLSEPDVGSSLGDVTTRAVPEGKDELGHRYRISGRKMWISAGDHDVTENIVHLVLGKAVQPGGGTRPGPKGTSLFIVPKLLPGAPAARNDISVAGLNHKMGYRGTPNCLLNFGDGDGAIGWRVGNEGDGLRIMFQMMNEARINVGLSGAAMAHRGWELSRQYAAERIQGRPVHDKQRETPVAILRHPDVRRMLLQQKAIAEGALALCLRSALLCDRIRTREERADTALLDLLTPVVKSWPSEQGLVSLHQAIQIHGGYGYTRDFDVEQLYRDSRLNPIHEGTTGIQAIDLVGRKILGDDGKAMFAFLETVRQTARAASAFPDEADTLREHCALFETLVGEMLSYANPSETLANATAFLDGFGHFVVAWLWLDMAAAAGQGANPQIAEEKRWACRYFYGAEVPKIAGMLAPLRHDRTLTRDVPDHIFG
ncbi:acyl-CoA dehydrogenase [Salipiger abyssi]|uniref:acyl-CoA dehydrogenase n=1 Tax=Salipiger abyssi TaxID=1250539 RepID=UPI001A8F4140|nr:acyl-CoA dehydrogenase [Salipiger abyssi]MBN9887159.1 acyl-CoA dehydrogenase [Salipiger abyssi]